MLVCVQLPAIFEEKDIMVGHASRLHPSPSRQTWTIRRALTERVLS